MRRLLKAKPTWIFLSIVATLTIMGLLVDNVAASTGGLSLVTPSKKAQLVNGKAIPPEGAPPRVVRVIRAANRIRNEPYVYGGGHGSFESSGYDCSGSVSYALRGGRFVRTPLTSGSFMGWGRSGKGRWITVYANSGHAYMVVAGLRFDTSQTAGDGPGWSKRMVSSSGFAKRNPGKGY